MFKIAFMEFKCVEETSDGSASDEVYALIFVGDLMGPAPRSRLFRSKMFSDVDEGEFKKQWIRVWGIDGTPREITNPDRFLILCGFMEWDHSEIPDVVSSTDQAASGAFLQSVFNGDNHATISHKVRAQMRVGMQAGALISSPTGPDDLIDVEELVLTAGDLASARNGNLVTRSVELSGDGGKYRALFHMRYGPD